jgi:hypothetical protein
MKKVEPTANKSGIMSDKSEQTPPKKSMGSILSKHISNSNNNSKCHCNLSPLKKTAAWTRKEGKDPKGGLNQKGVDSYRRENPGSKLQTAVTKKPSELKAGSKDANRRKSFCARMSGMPGPMKKPNGEPTRKKLALDKWNC